MELPPWRSRSYQHPYARQPDPQAEDITPAEVNAAVAHLYGVRREPVTLDSLCIGLRIRETQDRKINGLIKKLEEHPRAQRMAREVTGCVSFRYWPPMHITNGDELLRFLRDPGLRSSALRPCRSRGRTASRL